MSGDANRHNEPEFSDDDVKDQRPDKGLHDLFAQRSPDTGDDAAEPVAPDEEDLLFDQAAAEGAPPPADGEQYAGREQFNENSSVRWPGHRMSAGDIGIPVQGEESPAERPLDDLELQEVGDLELVEDESGLEAETAAAAADGPEGDLFVIEEGADQGGDLFVLEDADDEAVESFAVDEGAADHQSLIGDAEEQADESSGDDAELETAAAADAGGGTFLADEPMPEDAYPVEEGWEPLAAADSLETDGAEPVAEAEGESEPYENPVAEQEVSEMYVEATTGSAVMAPRRSHRFLRVAGTLVAAGLVVAAGATVVLRPEWVGLQFQPQLVERVQIARPTIDVRVPTPAMPAAAVRPLPMPTPTDPPADPPADPLPPPIDVVPVPIPLPVPVPLPTPDTPTNPLPNNPPQPLNPAALVPVGDNMWIGDYAANQPSNVVWNNVSIGSKAFAQLNNGNFIVGSVKGAAAEALVLKVDAGEISLGRDEVAAVTPLDSDEYSALQKATSGFIRLSNNNRLAGSILKSVVDDHYILQMRSDRIVVPKKFVDKVVEKSETGEVRFDRAEDEDQWLLEVARQQLQAMSTGQPATKPLPSRSLPTPPVSRTPVQAPKPPPKTAKPAEKPAPRTRPKPK